MSAETLASYVARTLTTAPPLTNEQRERVARLLTPVATAIGGGRR